MDGEFLVEEKFGYTGGSTGNFLILGEDKEGTLKLPRRL